MIKMISPKRIFGKYIKRLYSNKRIFKDYIKRLEQIGNKVITDEEEKKEKRKEIRDIVKNAYEFVKIDSIKGLFDESNFVYPSGSKNSNDHHYNNNDDDYDDLDDEDSNDDSSNNDSTNREPEFIISDTTNYLLDLLKDLISNKKFCPQGKHFILKKYDFCPDHGTELVRDFLFPAKLLMLYCRSDGKKFSRDQTFKFCPHCGSQLIKLKDITSQ